MLPSGPVLHNWPCEFQDFQLQMEGLVMVTYRGEHCTNGRSDDSNNHTHDSRFLHNRI